MGLEVDTVGNISYAEDTPALRQHLRLVDGAAQHHLLEDHNVVEDNPDRAEDAHRYEHRYGVPMSWCLMGIRDNGEPQELYCGAVYGEVRDDALKHSLGGGDYEVWGYAVLHGEVDYDADVDYAFGAKNGRVTY